MKVLGRGHYQLITPTKWDASQYQAGLKGAWGKMTRAGYTIPRLYSVFAVTFGSILAS